VVPEPGTRRVETKRGDAQSAPFVVFFQGRTLLVFGRRFRCGQEREGGVREKAFLRRVGGLARSVMTYRMRTSSRRPRRRGTPRRARARARAAASCRRRARVEK
jgi:hypothetical protein